MTEKDIQNLAEIIAKKLNEHPVKCKVFTDEDIQGIKEIAALFKSGKSAFLKLLLSAIYIGLGVVVVIGFREWLKEFLFGKN